MFCNPPNVLQLRIKNSLGEWYNWAGLPRWFSDKESARQCRIRRRYGFDLWIRKIPWRRAWQLTPVFLSVEIHRQRSLEGYSLWVAKSQTWLSDWACTHKWIFLLRKKLSLLSTQLHASTWLMSTAEACQPGNFILMGFSKYPSEKHKIQNTIAPLVLGCVITEERQKWGHYSSSHQRRGLLIVYGFYLLM